jgi:hypothetical protein
MSRSLQAVPSMTSRALLPLVALSQPVATVRTPVRLETKTVAAPDPQLPQDRKGQR